MKRYYYANSIRNFLSDSSEEILGQITGSDLFDTMQTQKRAWQAEISILKQCLVEFEGDIFFEFSIPRMGRRIDVVLVVQHVIFVVEFKVEEKVFSNHAIDQVFDYALDLKNFHETSPLSTAYALMELEFYAIKF